MRPIKNRVIIEPHSAETTTASGIIIPDTAQEKPSKGTVIAVGKGKDGIPMEVKVGDVVLYGKHSGTEMTVEGKTVLIMIEDNIWAIV
jgi:chaperonin GroES